MVITFNHHFVGMVPDVVKARSLAQFSKIRAQVEKKRWLDRYQ